MKNTSANINSFRCTSNSEQESFLLKFVDNKYGRNTTSLCSIDRIVKLFKADTGATTFVLPEDLGHESKLKES